MKNKTNRPTPRTVCKNMSQHDYTIVHSSDEGGE